MRFNYKKTKKNPDDVEEKVVLNLTADEVMQLYPQIRRQVELIEADAKAGLGTGKQVEPGMTIFGG
jgi:hypothetical protein